jgi:hypothetical protein
MPRTVADRFADDPAAAGLKRVCGIVGDNLIGLGDAIRRQGKIVAAFAADALRQVDLGIGNAGIPEVASLTARHKVCHRTAGRAAAMLAFAAGLLVAAIGAGAGDGPARLQPTAERAGTDCVRAQPADQQFAPPRKPDVSTADARCVDALYHMLIGPQPANSPDRRSTIRPSGIVE